MIEKCWICGKDCNTNEDVPGEECQLGNGKWVCSFECWDIVCETKEGFF